jgi:hypothetical protein
LLLLIGVIVGKAPDAVSATLLKAIDATRSKVGDQVVAKTTEPLKKDGKTVVPKGAKLVGHVVQLKARSNDEHASQVVISFDEITDAGGKTLPFSASISSISRPQSTAPPSDAAGGDLGIPSASGGSPSPAPREGRSGGGLVGPSTGSAKAAENDQESQTRAASAFTIQQRADGTVISSNSRNIRLDSGTQLLLIIKSK